MAHTTTHYMLGPSMLENVKVAATPAALPKEQQQNNQQQSNQFSQCFRQFNRPQQEL